MKKQKKKAKQSNAKERKRNELSKDLPDTVQVAEV